MSRSKRKRRNRQMKKETKIIRCEKHYKPVFEREVCSSFSFKDTSNNQKNCANCVHSY